MAKRQDVLVPDIGDFEDVEIVEVMVAAGEEVAAEDSLITLETDKAAMDVPAPVAGKIVEMSVSMGDRVSQGSLILVLEVDDAAAETQIKKVCECLEFKACQSFPLLSGHTFLFSHLCWFSKVIIQPPFLIVIEDFRRYNHRL